MQLGGTRTALVLVQVAPTGLTRRDKRCSYTYMAAAATPSETADPGRCTCFHLRRAARALSRRYDAGLKKSGLRANQFSILAVAGNAGPQPLGQLAERLGMDRTTLTRNLRPLERDGLLEVRAGEDRRSRWIEITPAGRQRLETALPLWQAVQRSVVDELGMADWQHLIGQLTRF